MPRASAKIFQLFFSFSITFSELRERPLSFASAFHVEPGTREKALLADNPALKRFKSNRKGIRTVKRVGDVLTIAIVAGCCYEMYVRANMREETREHAGESA